MQLVSSLIAGVLLAFGVSVVVLFVTAHLAAGGKIGTGAVGNAEVIASGLGCFCGSCYLALSYRKRILLLGLGHRRAVLPDVDVHRRPGLHRRVPAGRDAQPYRRRGRWGSGGVLVRWVLPKRK